MKVEDSGPAISTAIERLYDGVVQPDRMPEALRHLANLAEAHTALLILHDRAGHRPCGLLSRGSDERLVSDEVMAQSPANPWTRAALQQLRGSLLLTDQLVTRAELRRSPFYDRVVRPLGIDHGMGCVFAINGDAQAFVVVHRSVDQGPFGQAAVARYQSVLPHLQRVCQLSASIAEIRAGQAVATAALQRLRVGVIVTDRARRVHIANRAAKRLLLGRSRRALTIKDHRLAADSEAENHRLERLIADAADGGRRVAATRVHSSRTRPGVDLVVMPMPGATALPGASALPGVWHASPAALVLLRDSNDLPENLDHLLQQLYGLTPAEARVARAILAGHGLKRSTELLGMSLSTGRTHLCRIFEKTGTNRQAELVRLLADGPALLAADDPARDS